MRKLLTVLLALLVGATGVIGVTVSAQWEEPDLDYMAIPGVTQEEIDSIEALQRSGRTFSYGVMPSTEAFLDENGQLAGYAANLCRLLSQLFDIQFVPSLHDWDALVEQMANKSLDFSGEFTRTAEQDQAFLMSDAVAVRSVALFYPADGEDIRDIAEYRTPVLGFLNGSIHQRQLAEVYDGAFESIYLERLADVSAALAAGEIDAFVGDDVAEPVFENDRKIICETYSPLICNAVSFSTRRSELWSVISILDKYIESGGQAALSSQYALGMAEYTRFVLRRNFTAEEKAYIDSHIASNERIPVILESGNYPISFYNGTSQEFQGIVPDLLEQITALTGLQFESINDPSEGWATVLAKLQSGEAKLISELLHTESRKNQFLWPEDPSCITNYALLSKSDVPNLGIYQLLGKRVGVEIDTAYHDFASQWFPHVELLTYLSIDDAFEALDTGEIDLIMASENMLLSQTNYSEKPGYKVNLTIDYTAESKLGFHIDETVLLSIFDKAFPFVGSDSIVRNWENRVFDYSARLSQARAELLMISTILLAAFIALLVLFLIKNSRHRRDLSSTVKARTAQLAEKTAALSTIYNAIPDLLFSKDTQGRYTSCNPSFEAYAGLPESEIIGKYASELFSHIDADALDLESAQDQAVIRSDTSNVVEQLVTYPSGEQRLLETIKTSLRQNGVVVGMMGISRDITAHKAAQEAAQTASKAKGSFLARMSHEMRTPLNAIIGMAEITKASVGNTAKTISSVNQIIVSSHHLLSLINDVLDMSKIESGNLEILNRPFNLREGLDEALTIVRSRCEEKRLVFENNVSQIPGIAIIGDKLRLNQVLINLLSNAAKFTDAYGHIEFSVNIIAETADDICIRFAVRDSGIGMSEEQISRLFKPFEQADGSIAPRFGGTGLGLSISQNLVQRMGGVISIESAMGAGSEFSFELSFKKCAFSPTSAKVQDHALNFTGSRILLAEDIEINRVIVKELLSPTKLHIDVATNGREAAEMFERAAPGYYQLIFMDIQMPEMDGYEATAKIRALSRPDAKEISIIAMTANAYKEDVEQSLAAGMNGHIGKPIDIGELMKTLATYLTDVAEPAAAPRR